MRGNKTMKRLLIGSLLLVGAGVSSVAAQQGCPVFVQQAVQAISTSCDTTQRNQACYGNGAIGVAPQPNVRLEPFDRVGDLLALNAIQSLTLSPLNAATQEWGLSLLKVQATLPDTLPGQNVTMIVSGDVSLENAGENMEAFYFTSGIGDIECQSAPDGIMIQTPAGAGQIELTVNEIRVSVGSTVFLNSLTPDALSAELDAATLSADTDPDQLDVAREAMTEDTGLLAFTLLEGQVSVSSDEVTTTVTPLETLVLQPMGEEGMYKTVASYDLPLDVLEERFGDLVQALPEPVDLEAVASAEPSAEATDSADGACESPRSGTWQTTLVSSDVSQCPLIGQGVLQGFESAAPTYIEFPDDFTVDALIALNVGMQDMGGISTSQIDECTFQIAADVEGAQFEFTYRLQTANQIAFDYNFNFVSPDITCVATINLQATRIGD